MSVPAQSAAMAKGPTQSTLLARRRLLVRYFRTPKGLLTLVYLMLLLIGGTEAGWAAALPHVAAAIFGACFMDAVMGWFMVKSWRWPTGALLSGLTSAFILSTHDPWGVSLAVGGIAASSKYVVRRKSHVLNPAAFGLLISIPLFSTAHSWWGALGEAPWPWTAALIAGGVFIVDRLNKFTLVFGFLGSYFCFFLLAGLGAPTQVSEIFRTPFLQASLFLAFFMLTDPPTSPNQPAQQLWIGVLDGAVCGATQVLGAGQAYLLLGVLAGNAAFALSQERFFDVRGFFTFWSRHPSLKKKNGSDGCE